MLSAREEWPRLRKLARILSPFAAAALLGCTNEMTAPSYLVRGTAEGISGTPVVLDNNGTDAVTVAQDGDFYFAGELADGATYSVSVADKPSSLSCTLTHRAGVISGADAADVLLQCTRSFSVGGVVTGLTGDGLILENNHAAAVALSRDGAFVFDALAADAAYEITVSQSPAGETCNVASGAKGVVAGADVENVVVTCVADEAHSLRGNVVGLATGSLLLQNGSADAVSVAADGSFYFPKTVPRGGAYDVTIASQLDTAQRCIVQNGIGVMVDRDVDDVSVTCAPD